MVSVISTRRFILRRATWIASCWVCSLTNTYRTNELSYRGLTCDIHRRFIKSSLVCLTCGAPQGSVLGFLLLNRHTAELIVLIEEKRLSPHIPHIYGDDTQVYGFCQAFAVGLSTYIRQKSLSTSASSSARQMHEEGEANAQWIIGDPEILLTFTNFHKFHKLVQGKFLKIKATTARCLTLQLALKLPNSIKTGAKIVTIFSCQKNARCSRMSPTQIECCQN